MVDNFCHLFPNLLGLGIHPSQSYAQPDSQLLLSLSLQPLLQFVQRFAPVADFVLLTLLHLCICLAIVLEARVPACFTLAQNIICERQLRTEYSRAPALD